MSQSNYQRITAAKGDPYKVLNLDKSATAEQVKSAYKELALEFHPDRIKLPSAKPGSFEEDLVLDYKSKASEVFKAISSAFHILSDSTKREEYNKRASPGLTVATYNPRDSQRPPSRSSSYLSSPNSIAPSSYGSSAFGSSPSSISSYSTSPPQQKPPTRAQSTGTNLRRSSSAAGQRPEMQALANFDDFNHAPPYRNQSAMDPYDHLTQMGNGGNNNKVDPFDLFADMFGAGGKPAGGSMFGEFGGKRMSQQQPRARRTSMGGAPPMDPFAAMMNQMGAGGGDMFGMSPEGPDDPFSKMFDGLNMGGEGKQGQRGGFAHYKQTKRHRDRFGNVTASMQSKSVAMYDAGPAGQICVENTMRVQGFRPSTNAGSQQQSRVEDIADDFGLGHRSYTPHPPTHRRFEPERSFTAPTQRVLPPASSPYASSMATSPYQALPAPPSQQLQRRMSTASNPYLPSSRTPLGIEPPPYSSGYSTPMLTNGPEYGSSAGRRAIGW